MSERDHGQRDRRVDGEISHFEGHVRRGGAAVSRQKPQRPGLGRKAKRHRASRTPRGCARRQHQTRSRQQRQCPAEAASDGWGAAPLVAWIGRAAVLLTVWKAATSKTGPTATAKCRHRAARGVARCNSITSGRAASIGPVHTGHVRNVAMPATPKTAAGHADGRCAHATTAQNIATPKSSATTWARNESCANESIVNAGSRNNHAVPAAASGMRARSVLPSRSKTSEKMPNLSATLETTTA